MPITHHLPGSLSISLVHDCRRWDDALRAQPQGSFLQSYAWGRHKQHFGWVPVRLRVDGAGRAPLLAQILFRRIPFTPYTLGYIPRGPLVNYADRGQVAVMVRALAVL